MEKKCKSNPISVQSKKWIVEALLKLLEQKPYDEVTITEIVSKAQLARCTFYRNFNSKEDVLNLYIQKLVVQYIRLLKKEKVLNVYNGARVFFNFWKKYIDFLILMDKNNLLYMILQKYSSYLPTIHKLVKADKKYENDEILEYVLTFSAGGFSNMLIKWVNDGAKKSPDEMASLVSRILNENLI